MEETTKRLAPKPETLRELFLKSGNLCAFPNCSQLMMNSDGVFIGQVCHIEAAEYGGERFNPKMTNEQRRGFKNLMLMCYEHHTITNDVSKYPVATLQKMKSEHERRFSDPDLAILERLKDWTKDASPTAPRNLRRFYAACGLTLDPEQTANDVAEVTKYLEVLKKVPIEMRRIVAAIAARMHTMSGTPAFESSDYSEKLLIEDLRAALRLSDSKARTWVTQLEAYGLGGLAFIDSELGQQPAISIRSLPSGWPIWTSLVDFCEKTDVPLSAFSEDLDFSRLDD